MLESEDHSHSHHPGQTLCYSCPIHSLQIQVLCIIFLSRVTASNLTYTPRLFAEEDLTKAGLLRKSSLFFRISVGVLPLMWHVRRQPLCQHTKYPGTVQVGPKMAYLANIHIRKGDCEAVGYCINQSITSICRSDML